MHNSVALHRDIIHHHSDHSDYAPGTIATCQLANNEMGMLHTCKLLLVMGVRPISQTVFMLSIAINRAENVCATAIIKHNFLLMCNLKSVVSIMLCLLNSTGHI